MYLIYKKREADFHKKEALWKYSLAMVKANITHLAYIYNSSCYYSIDINVSRNNQRHNSLKIILNY